MSKPLRLLTVRDLMVITPDTHYPNDWPPKEFLVDQSKMHSADMSRFAKLIRDGSGETAIDRMIRDSRWLLSAFLAPFNTGHHASWVVPQQAIRPKGAGLRGLKPDYLVGGHSSDGFEWFIVELKGANAKLFAHRGDKLRLSDTAHGGIVQVLEYLDYAEAQQAYLRETLKLTGFRDPKAVLFVGRESEFAEDSHARNLKAQLNRVLAPRLTVRTYDALLRKIPTSAPRPSTTKKAARR